MSDAPAWIPFLQPTATLAAAGAVAFYAHQQWKLAKQQLILAKEQRKLTEDRLRLDLFEKRYKVYDSAIRFVKELLAVDEEIDVLLFQEFVVGTSDAEFLFGTEVVAYLEQLLETANSMNLFLQKLSKDNPNLEKDRTTYKLRTAHLRLSLSLELSEMRKVFVPYLGYANIRSGAIMETADSTTPAAQAMPGISLPE